MMTAAQSMSPLLRRRLPLQGTRQLSISPWPQTRTAMSTARRADRSAALYHDPTPNPALI